MTEEDEEENDRERGAVPILSFGDVKKRLAEHLRTAVGADEFDIASAKLEEVQNIL